MGLGDDIIVTRQARILYEQTKKCVVPMIDKRLRWSQIYDNNPIMTNRESNNTISLELRPRPYVKEHIQRENRFVFQKNNLGPGEIYLSDNEIATAKSKLNNNLFVYIEPNIKGKVSSTNKDWGFEKYQQVVNLIKECNSDVEFVQCGISGTHYLNNVQQIKTNNIREALAILSLSKLYVGNEGCMHHAAAAFSIPGVVIFGGYISPESTGYNIHKNLYVESDEYPYGCGTLVKKCSHCAKAMESISVDQVVDEIKLLEIF